MQLPEGKIEVPKRESASYFSRSRFVKELTDKDFQDECAYKLKKRKCGVILFYAPWCPHCKAVKGVWEELGEMLPSHNIYAMNCELYREQYEKMKREVPDLINGFPSIIIYNRGEPQAKYEGPRTKEGLSKAVIGTCGTI